MAMSVHTKWKVIENSQLPVLFFNNPHTEGTKNTTDYVAHKYEAKYVTIINVLNRWGNYWPADGYYVLSEA
jgi:hypothetical protein